MGGAALFGGGFFYQPFTQAGVFAGAITSGLLGVFGAWTEIVASMPFAGRWVDLRAWQVTVTDEYRVQLGIGPAGAEVAWQPTTGTGIPGFPFSLNALVDGLPVVYSFPCSLPRNTRLSARTLIGAPGAGTIYLWPSIWG